MRAVVLDPTLEVSLRARQVLPALGVRVSYACSMSELAVVLPGVPPAALLIVHVNGDLSTWEVAEQIRRMAFAGNVLALIGDVDDSGMPHLMRLPGVRCFTRPASPEAIDELLKDAVAHVDPAACRWSVLGGDQLPTYQGIVGQSKQMREIFARIDKIAGGDSNVCIYGESGTGKELIAYAIHCASRRRDRVFVPLDCSTIPESLMESHLFGHVKGAFTGAVENHEGVFSLADTGTLFIDELCELSLPIQVKLLRVIQTREFMKVGGTKPMRTNIRLVTATNRDPKQEVEKKRFREDLYYRIAVIMIRVPPLRERSDDIPLLVSHFVNKFSETYGKPVVGVDPVAMERLVSAPWPGNIRQLENVIEQAVVLTDSDTLRESDLFTSSSFTTASSPTSALELEPGLSLREVERRYILRTLDAVRGNRSEAARRLRISLRALQYKLKEYGRDHAGDPSGASATQSSRPRQASACEPLRSPWS